MLKHETAETTVRLNSGLTGLFLAHSSSQNSCESRDLDCQALQMYWAIWRIELQRIWGLPHHPNYENVSLVSMTGPSTDIVCQRCCNFTTDCTSSSNALVSFVTHQAPSGCIWTQPGHLIFSSVHVIPIAFSEFLRIYYSSNETDIPYVRQLWRRLFPLKWHLK